MVGRGPLSRVCRGGDRPASASDDGFTLVGLLVLVAVVNVAMAVAVTSWVTLDKRAREAELIWRGQRIAAAIGCFGREHASEPLDKLEQLVEANCLRRLYREPFAKDGQWRVLRQQDLADGTIAELLGLPVPEATPGPEGLGGGGQGMIGVASNSQAKGLRTIRGREHYNEWIFLAESSP